MDENLEDTTCSNIRSIAKDLTNLVTWAHTHGTICNQIPALEIVQGMDRPTRDNSVLWICVTGHAYHWRCGRALYFRSREESVEQKKRPQTSDSCSTEHNLSKKRYRVSSLKADSESTGCHSRSPGIAQKKEANMCFIACDIAVPPENQSGLIPLKDSNSTRPRCTAEQNMLLMASRATTDQGTGLTKSMEDLQDISDEEQFEAEEGPKINWNILSDTQNKEDLAEYELQVQGDRNRGSSQDTATQTSISVCKGKAVTTPFLQEILERSSPESLENHCLNLIVPPPAKSRSKTSGAGNPSESAVSKEQLTATPIPSMETRAPFEPPVFRAFRDSAPPGVVHQLCPSEHATSGTGLVGNAAETPGGESKQSGSQTAASALASPAPENESAKDGLPAPSNKKVVRKSESKRIRNISDIKMFRDWLALHYPSEKREIFTLPPEALDNYLASFYTNVRKQNGAEFSASSLFFFQSSIERYLKEHKYEYSVVKGFEFAASQEALKVKGQQLAQKERERDWSILENLTDRDVEDLRKKGILSRMHPEGFLHLMLVNIVRGFGANTHHQTQNLWWGQVLLKKNKEGVEYLEWKENLNAKANPEESGLCIYAKPDNPGSCPVWDYKEYARRRPLDMFHDHDPFYLSPKPLCSIWDQIWYCRKSLTKTKMEKMMKVIIQQVKGSEKRSTK
ncbi:PREDICTED: uncharacterized protein KIAA1958 homolog [Gavialis gangeticus]|uniref:uncharacterized protein KIAA1958 homolog n=1 Tax=Gavialis gangeticus TaxID=94835 RepID=UPI00092E40BA|nr:PREDICTED: uncharacterized protein KIAA1958 homolog [Gavialis gangeticus]